MTIPPHFANSNLTRAHTAKKRFYYLTGLLFGIPVSIQLLVVCLYSYNAPFADDLSVAYSIRSLDQAKNLAHFIQIAIDYHNEHRLFVVRVVTWLLYKASGDIINVNQWCFLGNAGFVITLYVFCKAYAKETGLYLLLPLPYLLLQLSGYELMVWGMASIQNVHVIMWAIISIYLLTFQKHTTGFGLAIVAGLLASATSANGIFCFLAGAGCLLLSRRWVQLAVWTLSAIVVAALYLQKLPPGFAESTPGSGFSLSGFLQSFLALSGAVIDSHRYPIVSIILGCFVWGALILLLYKRLSFWLINKHLPDRLLFTLGVFFFVILSMLAIAFGRDFVQIMGISRYRLYASLLLILAFLFAIDSLTNLQFRLVLLASILLYTVNAFRYLPQLKVSMGRKEAAIANWLQTGLFTDGVGRMDYSIVWGQALMQTLREEKFNLEPSINAFTSSTLQSTVPLCTSLVLERDSLQGIITAQLDGATVNKRVVVLIQNARERIVLPVSDSGITPFKMVANAPKTQPLVGFVDYRLLPPGSYTVAVGFRRGNTLIVQSTTHTVRVKLVANVRDVEVL